MSGFVRRFTEVPTLEVIREIEGLVIVDIAPPAPATGAGSGTILLVGEFEDGYFATDLLANGAVEVYGSSDYQKKFGGFGYTYNGVTANHPSARRSLAENWNGNGWIKSYKLKCQRLLIARVDTSVGEVTFSPHATIKSRTPGPWALAAAMVISVTTNVGTGTTAALTAAAATVTGSAASFASIVAGDTFGLDVDGQGLTTVTFASTDTTIGAVVARINTALGATVASNSSSQLRLTGSRLGTGGSIRLVETTTGVLAKLGHTAATTAGTGNVANLAAVTGAEVAGLINDSASMGSANVSARVGADGLLWIYHEVSSSTATLQVDPGTGGMAAALGFTLDTDVSVATNAAGTIPAGTRVQASSIAGGEWVTMQSLDVPAGNGEPMTVRVRPGLDNGTHVGAAGSTINTIVDVPTFGMVTVTNPAALTAALTESQKDAAYKEALDATLNEAGPAREANYLLCARRSDAIVREGRANQITAGEIGLFARIFITGDPLGTTPDQAIANVQNFRSDGVFYTTLGLKVYVPAIGKRGLDGGIGFTADGIITVRADAPLATLCAKLAPEENPGQQTGLIDDFFAVDANGAAISIDTYKAFRRNGISAPRVDRTAGTIFQSGVTSSLESGRTTMARRKFANFLADSSVAIFMPYVKKLARATTRAKALSKWNQFLADLESASAPERSRLAAWSTDDSANAGNTANTLALGVYYIATTVRSLSSLDDIVLVIEAGENAVVTSTK